MLNENKQKLINSHVKKIMYLIVLKNKGNVKSWSTIQIFKSIKINSNISSIIEHTITNENIINCT